MPQSIEASCTFLVPPNVLYAAFLDSRELSRMTLSSAEVNPEVGGEFTMFNGGVTGKTTFLDTNKQIRQDWRFSQWESGRYSKLVINFIPVSASRTRLEVIQDNIPDKDQHDNGGQDQLVLHGWKSKFFMGLEKVIGYPVDRD